MAPHIAGIYLVDHNKVRSDWGEAGAKAVKGVLDHHNDLGMHYISSAVDSLLISSTLGLYPDAKPRVIEPAGSCASLVVHEVLDLWDKDEEDLAFGDKCVNVSIISGVIHLLRLVI